MSNLIFRLREIALILHSVFNYIATPEEADPYFTEQWEGIRSGLFKIRIERILPFTADGIRTAQKELSTPGGTLAGKILIKIADE